MGAPRNNFIVSTILEMLNLDVPFVPLESPYAWLARKRRINRKQYRDSVRNLTRSGVLKIVKTVDGEFLELTKKGSLKLLLKKAKVVHTASWDGKWRLILFDIPEDFHSERDKFRKLLKQHNFYKLQGSVFINPYPLSRDCIDYLKETGLIKYIRILKVEEMDNDFLLRKHFSLPTK